MSESGLRINEALKVLGIRKIRVAEALGIASASVTNFCSGKNNPSKQTVKLISQKFGINEEWILTGEGEMLTPKNREQEIAQITASMLSETTDSFRLKLISHISRMTDEQIEILRDMVKALNEE